MLPINKIYNMDCIEGMKLLDDNSIDAIVTDPPYFLISKDGSGFMGKSWDSLNINTAYNILCKSDEFVKIAEKFFMLLRVEPNGVGANFVQGSASTKVKNNRVNLESSVPFVENGLNVIKAKSKVSLLSVHGIVLTKGEVLDMLKEMSSNHTSAIEKQSEDVLFVIPYLHITRLLRNIVPENVLKLPIEKICGEKETQVTLMDEVRIKSATEAMIGSMLGNKSMNEINIVVGCVENIVANTKYKHIISFHTNKQKIIQWIISLLFAINVIGEWKGNLNLSLMYRFHREWAKEAIRILKPGGHALIFGGARTYHRMTCGIEDAGFEIRDCIQWIYSTGFPKSLNISKAIDKMKGVEREVIGIGQYDKRRPRPTRETNIEGAEYGFGVGHLITAPSTLEAKQWNGFGTGLKPANEPIVLARKPISEKTIALNVLKWGTGGINIDECRIETDELTPRKNKNTESLLKKGFEGNPKTINPSPLGRFPANIILDEHAGRMLDEQTGQLKSGDNCKRTKVGSFLEHGGLGKEGDIQTTYGDKGGASRFFYCAKASKGERNKGLEGFEKEIGHNRFDKCKTCGGYILQNPDRPSACKCENPVREDNKIKGNFHPTVKPIKLLRYLVRLITPLKGIVLDPFIGSGTTAIACKIEKFKYIGFESNKEYCDIANKRLKAESTFGSLFDCWKEEK